MNLLDIIIMDGLSFAFPLFIMAVGGIYSEKSGIVNLALEGMQGIGAFTGALVAVIAAQHFTTLGSPLPVYLAFFSAFIGGGVFAMLHAALCIKFKANQVISGVVMNILAMALTTFLTSQINSTFFGAASNKFVLTTTNRFTIPVLSEIPIIKGIFTNIYPFVIIIMILGILAWYILYKTPFGMHLRACGDNPHAIDSAGLNVSKIRFGAVVISGALSGLGGMCFAYSISVQFSSSIYMGYGYLAIAALIFGNWEIIPTFFACLVFGFARSAGFSLTTAFELPAAYSDLFMILPYLLTLLLLMFFKSNKSPKALGEVYDKGKR